MTVLLQNRTISMILTVPDVEVLAPSSTSIVEKLDRSDIDKSYSIVKQDQSSDIDSISSMPVYHGSILRIEQHSDDQNASDLIIRVPNFQRVSLPSNDNDSKQPARIKRRAPICPILYGPTPNLSTTNSTHNFDNLKLSQTRVSNTNRLTTGLRSLSRAFTHGCKSKRSSVISEITTIPSALPDVEVMTEKLEVPKSSNKNLKHQNSISMIPKLSPPKILFIKRKNLKIRKKQPSSSISINTQTDLENNRINLTPTSTIITTQYAEVKKDDLPKMTTFFHQFIEPNDLNQETNILDDDYDREQHNETMRLSFDVEQQFTAISQLVSDFPISSIDADSLSTHRYSTISAIVPDMRISITDNDTEDISSPEQISTGISYDFDTKQSSQSIRNNISPKIDQQFRVQTSILQPDISVIRIGTSDLRTRTDRHLSGEQIDSTSNIEQGWYGVIHPDDETFAECYEVTYQIDPRYQNEKKQIQDLTTWTPLIPQNEYEQIERDNSINQKSQQFESKDRNREHLELINNITRNKSRSVDDLSRTSNDQTFTYQPESIAASSSSEISSRYCSLRRSNSYNGFGIYVSTDAETRREHFIRQVEDLSPGKQAGLKENDRILCINGTSVIDEDYTVVLQLIKHGLQTDTLDFDVITNDAYEQFKSQIDQLYQ